MDKKELQDLQMFGMGLDNSEDKKRKKIEKVSFKTIQKSSEKNINLSKKLIVFQNKLDKTMRFIGKWFFVQIKKFYNILRFWKFKRKLNSQGKKFDHEKIFYKIVETRKKRFSNVVITRKRVPYYYINDSVFSVLKPKKSIYYLNLKEDEHGGTYIRKTSHKGLNDSVWDFPVKKKNK